jgi:integrase
VVAPPKKGSAVADKFQFTQKSIEAIPLPPAGKRTVIRDAEVKGLLVEITSTGARTYYLYRKFAGKPRRFRIAAYSEIGLVAVRKQAQSMIVQLGAGQDPASVVSAPDDPTLDVVFEWWKRTHGLRKKTVEADAKMYALHLAALGARRVSAITRTDVRELHAKLGQAHQTAANRVLALLRAVINKAIADEVIPGPNPAVGIKAYAEKSRDRRLSLTEAQALFKALLATDSQQLRDYVLLSLFTGARRANLCAMAWADIDMGAAVWRIPETKNGRPQIIPLLAEEMAILTARKAAASGPWVFPGRTDAKTGKAKGVTGHLVEPKKGWATLLKRAGIGDLHIHDLRRSLGSFMVDTGASIEVIGKTLGHQSPAATAIYARLSLEPVKLAKARAIEAMQG